MIIEEELFARHVGKSILLDSNLLLVFLTGSVGTHLFRVFKRVSDYTIEDYELLVRLLESFTVLLTTPHILTEVSNLANSLPQSYKRDWYQNLSDLVASAEESIGFREEWTPAVQLAETPEFVAFGITDAALTKLSSKALLVTEDHRLAGVLRGQGISVLNFGDLRKIQRFAND
jgi:hypothetical protein